MTGIRCSTLIAAAVAALGEACFAGSSIAGAVTAAEATEFEASCAALPAAATRPSSCEGEMGADAAAAAAQAFTASAKTSGKEDCP